MTTSLHPAVHFEVPGEAFTGDVPLVANIRGGHASGIHRGIAAVVDAAGQEILALGDSSQSAFLRSSAKPFQSMPAVLSGGVDRFGLTERELAVLCASHIAQPYHIEAVLSVLGKIGLEEAALQCGVHPPLHQPTAKQRIQEGLEPGPACNNCSGVHAGMLVACRAMGWPIEDYGNPEHPLQLWIREILAAFTALDAAQITYGIDNCAVPTWRMPVRAAAQAFALLASGRELDGDLKQAAGRITRAMTSYPEMVGGEGRFDTILMQSAGGALVSKGGAEGFEGIGIAAEGLGIAIKITDGGAATGPVALRLLEYVGALTEEQQQELQNLAEPEIRNHQGAPVGRLTPVFRLGAEA